MPTSSELTFVPMQNLNAFVKNGGAIPWDDPDRAVTTLTEICDNVSPYETQLLAQAVRDGVPAALRRSFAREAGLSADQSIALVYKHLCKRIPINRAESEWAVRTIAVAAEYIPMPTLSLSADGASRADAPTGYSYQSKQPAPDSSQDRRLTEIEKREIASGRTQTNFIELPSRDVEASGQYSGPININRPSPKPTDAIAQSAPQSQEEPKYGSIRSTQPSPHAMRRNPGPINLTLPADARAAAQRNNPYASPPAGQAAGVAGGGSWPPAPYAPAFQETQYWPESIIPEEVDNNKWCWSGFLGGVWWMWAHGMKLGIPLWLGLFVIGNLPGFWWLRPAFYVCLNIFLGLKGNALAWQYRSFSSKEQFRAVQRAWVIFGIFWNLLQLFAFGWLFVGMFLMYRAMAAGH